MLEMVAAGATKVAIAKTTGVAEMTILSVSKDSTKIFMKPPPNSKVLARSEMLGIRILVQSRISQDER
jgi:hypothetical protein